MAHGVGRQVGSGHAEDVDAGLKLVRVEDQGCGGDVAAVRAAHDRDLIISHPVLSPQPVAAGDKGLGILDGQFGRGMVEAATWPAGCGLSKVE